MSAYWTKNREGISSYIPLLSSSHEEEERANLRNLVFLINPDDG
jgi:hypothetical protein